MTVRFLVGVVVAVRALLEGGCAVIEFDLDAWSWCGNGETEDRRDSSKELDELHIENGNTSGRC
jgi:hypothetical protein